MKRILILWCMLAGIVGITVDANGRKSLLNEGWQFYLTDSVTAKQPLEKIETMEWTDVVLPHDWSILRPFDRNAAPGNDGGYLPAGKGWYRTSLDMKKLPKDRRVKLYFEGVYERSEVYVNGKLAGGHPYGYTSFFVDITPYLKKGKNEIAVLADNSHQKNSRWFTGSGIYRNVWLIETPDVGVADWGVGISTPDLTIANVAVKAQNSSAKNRKVSVSVEIDGIVKTKDLVLGPMGDSEVSFSFTVPDAKAWSPESPNLYMAKITVRENGHKIDEVEQPFGFRTISWSAEDGFRLNGKPMILNGGCVHHDNGILGAAAYDDAEWRKAEMLKKAGFNAVRTSHNPPSEAFLNACDELGLLVIDEAFDGWRDQKNRNDYHLLFDEWAAKDAEAMVMRDRNHPSIICWSIGNEIIERKKPRAVKDANMLAGVCRKIDPTRPVTQALASWDADWEIYDPLAAEHDIVGYNYMIHKAEGDHQRVPSRVMMQTESYPCDVWRNYRMAKDHPYVIGDFVWTAIDYIGESGIGRWYYEGEVEGEHYHRPLYPWHAAYCGDVDLIGLRKPVSHYRSMLWNEDGEKLYIAVREPDGYKGKVKITQWGTWPTFQSWNWPGHEGLPIDVEVYSRYPYVRLYQDGKLVDEKKTEEMKATFTVVYAPGKLVAEGIDGGKVMETVTLMSAGPVADLRMSAETPKKVVEGGRELVFVTIECVDKEGSPVTVADNRLAVDVLGPAELIALGNADIKDSDPYYDRSHKVWKGRALAILRMIPGNISEPVIMNVKTFDGCNQPLIHSMKIED